MVALVQRRQKDFSRRNRGSGVITYSPSATRVRRISSWIFMGFLALILVFALRYIFQSTVLSSDYVIRSVRYDSGSVSLFDEPALYSSITKSLQGKNYYTTKVFRSRALFSSLVAEFPMISSIKLFFLEQNTAAVSLQFHDPLMILIMGERKFAVYDAFTIIPLYTNNTLGQDVLHLEIAEYVDGTGEVEGMFFRISPEMLYSQLLVLDAYFMKPYTVVYFPGAEKTQITTADGKLMSINNLGNLSTQLAKIDLLKQHYDDFDNLWQFDLGSLDENTVIVKK